MRKNGYCVTHQVQTKKFHVLSQKWKDRGKGRGFGYVTTKVAKFQCSGGVLSHSIGNNSSASRNLDNSPGQISDYLTGIYGNRSQEGLVILEHSEKTNKTGD